MVFRLLVNLATEHDKIGNALKGILWIDDVSPDEPDTARNIA